MKLRPGDVVALGPSAAGSVLWRVAGRLHLTVVVKATFGLRDGGPMERLEARPLVGRDVHRDGAPIHSLVLPSDAAPYLGQADVMYVGHAHIHGEARARTRVRLALQRGERALVDKSLDVFGDRVSADASPAPFTRMPLTWERAARDVHGRDNPVGAFGALLPNVLSMSDRDVPGGFGPVSRYWRFRRELVDPRLRNALDEEVPDLPLGFDWSYFQAAPVDQRCELLHGDEWLLLDGLTAERRLVRSQLPRVAAACWIWPLEQPPASGWALDMHADSLFVDGDSAICTVTWRGAVPLADAKVLDGVAIASGVQLADAPIAWDRELPKIAEAKLARRRPSSTAVALGLGGSLSALPLSPQLGAAVAAAGKTQIRVEEAEDDLEATLVRPPAARAESDPLDSTVGVSADHQPGAATPFQAPAPTPERDAPATRPAVMPWEIAAAPLPAPPAPAAPAPAAPAPAATAPAATAAAAPSAAEDALESTLGLSQPVAPGVAAPFPLPAARRQVPVVLSPLPIPGAPWSPASAPTVRAPEAHLASTIALGGLFAPLALPPTQVAPRKGDAIPIVNPTNLWAVYQSWQLSPPQDSITVLVKGSFDIIPDRAAAPCDETDPPAGDVFVDDDIDKSLLHPSEFAVTKAMADVTLAGKAHAPNGAATEMRVRFVFGKGDGGFDRELAVFGARTLLPNPRGDRVTAPEPFEAIPLTYEHAYGGPAFVANPVGMGHPPAPEEGAPEPPPVPLVLPHLEDPGALIRSTRDRPAPVGFAPISTMWTSRRDKLGTFDDDWLATRWPYFPADFDAAFYQAAPAPQQVVRVRGDEPFELHGMHPNHPLLRGRLPGLRARCFVQSGSAEAGFRELDTVLDSVHFDVEAMKLQLVWRARLDDGDEHASELSAIFVSSEPLDARPATLEEAREAYMVAQAPLLPEKTEPDEPVAANDARPPTALETDLAAREAARDQTIAAAALPVVAPVRPPPPGADPEAAQRVLALVAAGGSLSKRDLSGAPLAGADLRGRDLSKANLQGANLEGALLEGADLTGAQLGGANLRSARAGLAKLDGADLSEADLTGADLTGASLRKATLLETRGDGASFTSVAAEKALFAEGSWRDARFHGAHLGEADFSKATLDDAVFEGANLRKARFYDARASKASFRRADLTDARGDAAVLVRCCFDEAQGDGSVWEGAILDDCSFAGSSFYGASFVKASCLAASYQRAQLLEARFKEAKLGRCNFAQANLMAATFLGADLREADLRGANLHSAETWKASLEGAKLDGTILSGTKLAPPPSDSQGTIP